jgi:EAL domain-containing protein (putative c-di-GMP-specific phosphodiesterase class I)
MIRDADTAMYRAKAEGKDRFVIFDQAMHQQAMNRLNVESELRQAIERDELVAYFQPVISLKTGTMLGAEALIRWQHPQRGLTQPDVFIGIAEESSLINALGSWILRHCCGLLKQWQTQYGPRAFTIGINLSSKQLAKEDFVTQVESILRETAVDPTGLVFEVTESALVSNSARTLAVLQQLQRKGIRFYLDDFGTGYSSLNMLHTFRLDGLKIDRSFVSGLRENQTATSDGADGRHYAAVIRAIVELSRSLNMVIVAEGVETEQQRDILREMQCRAAQGFFYSRPLPIADFENYLNQNFQRKSPQAHAAA